MATGFDPYPMSALTEYGSGQMADVIDTLAFEAVLAAGGEIHRPSDGRVPREVVFV